MNHQQSSRSLSAGDAGAATRAGRATAAAAAAAAARRSSGGRRPAPHGTRHTRVMEARASIRKHVRTPAPLNLPNRAPPPSGMMQQQPPPIMQQQQQLPQSLCLRRPHRPSLVSWPRTSRATIPPRVLNPSASANDQQQEPPVDVATGASERRTIGLSDAGDAPGDAGRCCDGRDERRQLGSHSKILSSLV